MHIPPYVIHYVQACVSCIGFYCVSLQWHKCITFILSFTQTLLKRRVKDASLYQMSLFLSSIGIFSTAVFWPILVILHASGMIVIIMCFVVVICFGLSCCNKLLLHYSTCKEHYATVIKSLVM